MKKKEKGNYYFVNMKGKRGKSGSSYIILVKKKK